MGKGFMKGGIFLNRQMLLYPCLHEIDIRAEGQYVEAYMNRSGKMRGPENSEPENQTLM